VSIPCLSEMTERLPVAGKMVKSIYYVFLEIPTVVRNRIQYLFAIYGGLRF
jgi:hypothetical protein